jgi:NADPH2:quinone reductase
MRAIQITEFGGPEVLRLADLPDPTPVDGFDLVEVTAAGVNYADTHQVENSYVSDTRLPLIPGSEVVGRRPDGTRVAALVGTGGYAERALAYPGTSFELPDAVSDGQALALMVQGLTAWHLLRTCSHLAPGDTVVVHAAAGGVGTLVIQLAKLWGAGRVVAVASSPAKLDLAQRLGADAGVDSADPDLARALVEANGGRPVDVVLEMVGGTTFDASLAALAPFGRLATYGMASRTPPSPVDPRQLLQHNRAVIGFWLAGCLAKPAMLRDLVATGALEPIVGGTYPLAEARRAHEDLRSRRTTGKLVLDPTV